MAHINFDAAINLLFLPSKSKLRVFLDDGRVMFDGDHALVERGRPLLLLDTNILTARARKRPPAGLREWLAETSEIADFCICFPVVVEMKRGLLLSSQPEQTERIREMIDEVLRSDFYYIGTGADTADIYAKMLSTGPLKQFWYVQPHTRHRRIGNDLLIAAISITHQIPIVTSDCDYEMIDHHFKLPGVYDPLAGKWTVEPEESFDLPPLHDRSDPLAH